MKTVESTFRVACHQRSGKYKTCRTKIQKLQVLLKVGLLLGF